MSLSWIAQQVVFASQELAASDKLLLTVLAQLDRGSEGAYIGEENLAQRVGLGADNVKRRRSGLVDAGLLVALKQRGRRAAGWRVQWPEAVTLPADGRFDADRFLALVHEFDGAIRMAREDARAAAGRVHPSPPIKNGKGALQSTYRKRRRADSSAPVAAEPEDAVAAEQVHPNTPIHTGKGALQSPDDTSEQVALDTPFSGKGCTPVPPKGALQCTPIELGRRSSLEISVSDVVRNPPNSAAPGAALGRGSGERSRERGHCTTGPEPIAAVLDRVELR